MSGNPEQPLHFRCASCGGINRVAQTRLTAGPKCGRCGAAIDLDAHPANLDDDQLDKLIASSPVPVLVDFWAAWCGPCRMVAPHIAALAKKHAGRLIVAKIDTERNQRTAARLKVRAIPTLAIWRGGRLEKSQAGALMGPQLAAFVDPWLSG